MKQKAFSSTIDVGIMAWLFPTCCLDGFPRVEIGMALQRFFRISVRVTRGCAFQSEKGGARCTTRNSGG